MDKFCIYCGKPLPESGLCDCELAAAARAASSEPPQEPEPPEFPSGAGQPEEPGQGAFDIQPEAESGENSPVQPQPAAEPAFDAPPVDGAAQPFDVQPEPGAGPAFDALPNAGAPESPEFQSPPAAENVYVSKTRKALGQLLPFARSYWKSPVNATLTVLQEKNLPLAVVMMVINALVSGILLFACCGKATGVLRETFEDLADLFGSSARVDVSAPFFLHLLLGILMAAAAMAIGAVLLFILLKLLKVNAGFSYVVMAVGVNSLPCTVCLLLALLFVLFGWGTGFGLALLLLAVTWCAAGMLLLVKVFGARCSGAMLTWSVVFLAAALALNVWVGGKLVLTAVGQIEVEGTKLKKSIEMLEDQMDDLDLESIFQGMMGGSYYNYNW